MEIVPVIDVIEQFGCLYWEPCGACDRDRYITRFQGGWQESLGEFLSTYLLSDPASCGRDAARERLDDALQAALDEFDGRPGSQGFAEGVWNAFREQVPPSLADTLLHHPLSPAGVSGVAITQFISVHAAAFDGNIGRWAQTMLEGRDIESAFADLVTVRGANPVMASTFLRDIAVAFNIEHADIRRSPYLQPVNRWSVIGAEALAGLPALEGALPDAEYRNILISASINNRCDPLRVSTGLEFLGRCFVRSAQELKLALTGPRALRSLLEHTIDRYTRAALNLDQRKRALQHMLWRSLKPVAEESSELAEA